MSNDYPRGSEWRKWDLHVHTPKSICQKFGADDDETWEKYISDLEKLPTDFAVLGINDYLFLDGYQRLLMEQERNNRLQNLVLLPVLEFRIEKFAGVEFGSLGRINLHVIFSNELSIETIKSQFLNTLEQSYTLESGNPWTRAITPHSVAELGAEIKRTVPLNELAQYGADLLEGFNNLNVNETQVFTSLKKDCFKGKYLIAVGKTEWADLKWTDASIATKKSIINSADIVFTSAESVEKFYKSKSQLTKHGVNDLLLDCSDAHEFSDSSYKDRIGNCFTWLKADTTFDGLKQVIIESKERIFIGDKPPLFERISLKRTKFIDKISITKKSGYDDKHGVWFDQIENKPLNSELVAIIGNKGSGKSAVADILAYCSNIKDNFSFLNPKKFWEKNGQIAKNFEANLVWQDGTEDKVNLHTGKDEVGKVKVKYLTQGKFEDLTNEGVKEFQEEIENVVFSYIPDEERLGANSFNELIDKKSSSVDLQLKSIRTKLIKLNSEIIALERKDTNEYTKQVGNDLKRKQEELSALVEPQAVTDPNEDPVKKAENEKTNQQIESYRSDISQIEENIEKLKSQKQEKINNINLLTTIKSNTQQHVQNLKTFIEDTKKQLSSIPLDIEKIVHINTDFAELDNYVSSEQKRLSSILEKLGESKQANSNQQSKPLNQQLEEKQGLLQKELNKLDAEQKAYQNYLTERAKWKKERERIIGKPEVSGTLSNLESEKDYLENKIKEELQEKYKKRETVAKEIYQNRQELIGFYKDVKERLNSIIESHADIMADYGIEIDALMIVRSDFVKKFLDQINKLKSGTFYSNEGSEDQLRLMMSECDFDDEGSVVAFLEKLIEAFKKDKRSGFKDAPRVIFDQVNDVEALYNYLFSLEFLDKQYKLKQGGKELDKLSPGERGALLLVFYLLLDSDDIPLIIDQPEDNLDNHSVATKLVPFIKKAKSKRQIIMVTHNPNLAVVADAEQIICVNIDKENGNKFSWESGSIENGNINGNIVKILEGAMPAFNTRKRKYYEKAVDKDKL